LREAAILNDGTRLPKIITSRFVKPELFGELLAGESPRSNQINLLKHKRNFFGREVLRLVALNLS
jgi:hypothetical protein